MIRQIMQQRADIAMTAAASGATITWLDMANQYVDLFAGLVAIVAGILTAVWYVKKFREGKK
jgi:flagellar biogenesis protein FliO